MSVTGDTVHTVLYHHAFTVTYSMCILWKWRKTSDEVINAEQKKQYYWTI